MAQELAGQVAIVTGGGGGFGRAIATRFAAEGASVTVTSRTKSQLDETVAQIESRGGEAAAIAGDATNRADVARVVQETQQRFGPVTVMINNAGVPGPFGPPLPPPPPSRHNIPARGWFITDGDQSISQSTH